MGKSIAAPKPNITKAAQKRISDQFEAAWTKTHKPSQNKNGEKR